MSRFFARKTSLIPAILAAALVFTTASPTHAKQTPQSKRSGARFYWKCLGQCLDILVQYDKALKRVNDPKQSMLVRVVDSNGKPIAGATVLSSTIVHTERGWTTSANFDTWEETFCHWARTKADGTARVARPTSKNEGVDVGVQADGHVASTARWNEDSSLFEAIPFEFTFQLEKSRPIGGVVRDASGHPIAGATVSLTLAADNPNDRVKPDVSSRNGHTDAQGRWRCDHTPSQIKGLTITVEKEGSPPLDLNQTACEAQRDKLQSQSAVFVIEKAYVVQGRITDLQGKPLPSATVWISQPSGDAMVRSNGVPTGDDGQYCFAEARAGTCEITVSGRRVVSQHRSIEVTRKLASVDFRLKPGRTIKIRVVDPQGKPVVGAEIDSDAGPFETTQKVIADTSVTDSTGRWATAGEPEEELPLNIHKEGYATAYRKLAAGDKEVLITLHPPIHVTGRVINAATRRPIQKPLVTTTNTPLGKQPDLCCSPTVAIDKDGRYELTFDDERGADAVAWQLQVQSPGYVTAMSRKFETREGSQTINIEMLPGPSVAGVVKRPDGTPVAGATVFLSTPSNTAMMDDGDLSKVFSPPCIQDRTGPDGRFELPMPLEPYVVGVVHDSGGAEIASHDLESRGLIVLQPWARVEGVVQGPSDPGPDNKETVRLDVNRVEDAGSLFTIGKVPGIDWSYSCDLASSRRFVFKRVLPGHAEMEAGWGLCVVAGQSASPWRKQNFTTVPGQTSRVAFARSGRPVTGNVAMPTGGSRKLATVGGAGLLIFQRPLVPVPPEIAKQPADVRKKWEQQWLKSDAGIAADRLAQNHSFEVAANGTFKADDVAPGVYKLAVNLRRAADAPDEIGDEIAWLVQEVTIPAGATDRPLDLGKYTATAANLLRGDIAPDFEFQTADGRKHRLSEYRGKRVIVTFTEKWANPTERFVFSYNAETTDVTPQLLREMYGKGPLVWINVTSDSSPRPNVAIAPNADFQFLHGFVPSKADTWKAYDVNRPQSWVETHIAQDGKVLRK
jgi:protocatechuate 3,4-dioxygenase beta subunit